MIIQETETRDRFYTKDKVRTFSYDSVVFYITLPRSPSFTNAELEPWLTIVADQKHNLIARL